MSAVLDTEGVFDLLADVSGARNPDPSKQNRGLCPAHSDLNNPGLTFTINDEGKLLVHCFAQHCSLVDIADAIGVPTHAFFPDSGSWSPGQIKPFIEWEEPPILLLFKLLPLGWSFEDRGRAVFRLLAHDMDVSWEPMHHFTYVELDSMIWDWFDGHWNYQEHGPWWETSDDTIRALRRLNRSERINPLDNP